MHDCYDLEVDASYLVTHICITTSRLHTCPHDIFDCAQFMRLHAMSQSFVTQFDMLDDDTCLVSHLWNAWCCTNANNIVFPSVCCSFSFWRNHKTVRHWRVPISSFKMTRTWWSTTPTRRRHLFPMVIWISIRGWIFPKGGEMMRSILWTSPCQEFVWQVTRVTSTSHTQRWIISFTRAHLTPSRMVYYLTLHSCACIGIVGTLQMTRRSACTKVQPHHPRGKRV